MDLFAQIAANGIGGRDELLYTPEPDRFKEKVCVLDRKQSAMEIMPKISTKDELLKKLNEIKRDYKEFLEDNAPKLKNYRKVTQINEFKLNGEKITIPHYQGPIGNQKQIYEAVFHAEISSDKAAYICFDGADYYAVVYVNDICVGTHEGFFSPFEFEITDVIKNGENSLKIELYNDYIYMGNAFADQENCEGDKLYAATGPGWDDALEGWHHCPAGMGIYNNVRFEVRNRLNITDLFVRPVSNGAEIWVEIENADYKDKYIGIDISIYGQNFREIVMENYRYVPETIKTVGRGDSLTEAMVKDLIGKGIPMPLKHGKNIFKIPVEIPNAKLWETNAPYLYQAQVSIVYNDNTEDSAKQQFGIRSFMQDTDKTPKGMFYLNGRKIRLRGANTMGFEQQDVMRGDIDQLIDDILLAKLCNMNFWRLTQRPVQNEVYEYCDRLGLMTQTDLPLFGCMRRTKLCEGVRQAEEMERLVRKHPCNVIVSYINEPFPNAYNEPHRHLNREELEGFFTMCDIAVHMQNPDRVIKHVDGDYDPPTEGMPDNHCYPMWYNGHGIDIGRLHKGYWLSVKPDWYYGCGEYGAEGLDFVDVMREKYPKEWIAEPFDPKNIISAQTGSFHYFFYDTPDTIDSWVEKSQAFQAFATKMMTEAFRRDNLMISNAIHLFIDAWPSGWMKTIMDCRRNPKPAYFAYRNALEPIMVSLRTDRFTYFSGEKIKIEAFICNDTNISGDYKLHFEYYTDGEYTAGNEIQVKLEDCKAEYGATAELTADAADRKSIRVRAVLTDMKDEIVTYNEITVEVFADTEMEKNNHVVLIEKLSVGEHEIAGEKVVVKPCGMLPLHFVSRKTGHRAVAEFKEKDFSYWYDKDSDMITPILETTFTANGFTPILTSGNTDESGEWNTALACAEKVYQGKRYIICQVDLRQENPVAKRFVSNLYKSEC